MPYYDYECAACEHLFETFQSMAEDALEVCPECEKNTLRRLITGGAGVIFKGSGFYVNDSRQSPEKKPAENGAAAAKSSPPASAPSSSNNKTASTG